MKKAICAVLCLALTFGLCACGLSNLKNVELPPLPQITEEPTPTATPFVPVMAAPTPEMTPLPTPEPTPVPTPEPTSTPVLEYLEMENQILINVRRTELEQFDPENGTRRILRFAYDTPIVSIEGRAAAAQAMNSELAARDESFYTGGESGRGFNGMLELAEDNFTLVRQAGGDESRLEFARTRFARVERADTQVLSLVFHEQEMTGSLNAEYAEDALVFNSETGALLTLEDLSGDYETLRAALTHILVTLTETDSSLYEHLYMDYVPNRDFYGKLVTLLRPGSWYFDDNGMVVFSRLYELGPYNAGLCVFHIPYARLEGVIDAKWFPVQRTEQGSLSVSGMGDVPNGSIGFVDRVEAEPEGEEFCLIASGAVYDLSISRVYYESGFHDAGLLWACSDLNNAAVQLVTRLPEGLPNLMVRYTDASGQTHASLLTVSGTDGSVQLVEESSVQPVG